MTEAAAAKSPIAQSPLFQRMAEESGLGESLFEQCLARSAEKVEGVRQTDLAKLLEVADELKLNVTLRHLYLIKTKQGPQVVIAIDGWLMLMHRHPEYIAHDVVDNYEDVTDPKSGEVSRRLCSATFKLWTRKREALKIGPYVWTEYMSECYVPPRGGYDGPWQTHPSRMIRHKAAAQGIRYELGVYVPTEDEFARAGLLLDDAIARTERGEAATDTRIAPVVPIRTLEHKPQGKPTTEDEPLGDQAVSPSPVSVVADASPADPGEPTEEEKAWLLAEEKRMAAEESAS